MDLPRQANSRSLLKVNASRLPRWESEGLRISRATPAIGKVETMGKRKGRLPYKRSLSIDSDRERP